MQTLSVEPFAGVLGVPNLRLSQNYDRTVFKSALPWPETVVPANGLSNQPNKFPTKTRPIRGSAFDVMEAEGKGLGAFAAANLEPGDRVLAERPLLRFEDSDAGLRRTATRGPAPGQTRGVAPVTLNCSIVGTVSQVKWDACCSTNPPNQLPANWFQLNSYIIGCGTYLLISPSTLWVNLQNRTRSEFC